VIEKVKGLETELQFEPLSNGSGLYGAEVETDILWPAQHAAARVPENLLRSRECNGRRIPPIQELLRAIVGIAGEVAIVLLEDNDIDSIIVGIESGCGQTGSHYADAATLPPAEQFVDRSRPVRPPTLASPEG